MNLDRFESLIGKEKLDIVSNIRVLIVGIGGVGGYALESLVRCGVKNITIVDYDIIDSSNLNRQIISNLNNIGSYKVDEAIKRYKNINNDINLVGLKLRIDEESIKQINFEEYDFIVDACDDVKAKTLIINNALESNKTIISSMGTAKKLDPSKIYLTTLNKTEYDPLAKKMRGLIDRKSQNKVNVVTSSEQPVKSDKLCSCSFVPGVAGLMITSFIINNIIK